MNARTYKPTTGNDRTAIFRLMSGVALYGGFRGDETDLAERDWVANETTPSGDLGAPGFGGFCGNGENTYHVVTATAVLDGFTVTAGERASGAGLYPDNSSPTIANVIFRLNQVCGSGAGAYLINASSQRIRAAWPSSAPPFRRSRCAGRGTGTVDSALAPPCEHVAGSKRPPESPPPLQASAPPDRRDYRPETAALDTVVRAVRPEFAADARARLRAGAGPRSQRIPHT